MNNSTFDNDVLIKMPEEASQQLHPATQLVEKRREMTLVEQDLLRQKEHYDAKTDLLKHRSQELARKEQALKECLLKFDKFLKENRDRKERALKKAADERKMQKQKDREIKRLKTEIEALLEVKARLKKKVDKYMIYYHYLESVLGATDEFAEVRDILDRYDTLVITHGDLMEREQKNQDCIDSIKAQMVAYSEDMKTEILGYNNQLSELQARFDDAQSTALKWESVWMHIKNTAAKKTLLLGQIKMACHNLFQIVSRHQKSVGHPVGAIEDTEEQLNKIQEVIEDLVFIVNEVKRNIQTTESDTSS